MATVDAAARSSVFTRLAAVALVILVGLLRAANLGDGWLPVIFMLMPGRLLGGAAHESIEYGRQRGLGRYATWLPRAILLDACIVCAVRGREEREGLSQATINRGE